MDSIVRHPHLHAKLENFSIFYSFHEILETKQKAIAFAAEIGLIPKKTSFPPECCGLLMVVEESVDRKLGWRWRCSISSSKKKGSKACRRTVNPSIGTVFDGESCRIELRDVLAMLFCFVLNMRVMDVYKHLLNFRRHNQELELSVSTVIDYYSYFREVAEVVASHTDVPLGGEGKTIQIDETFLTNRKYNRGRITDQMTIVVLGIYCKEDRSGLFFKVNSKSKADIWPYLKKYIDPKTSFVCTDSAKQYVGVEKLFSSNTLHMQTNHSKGEFVESGNSKNTINDLENQNKLLKKSILCRRTPKLLHQYMALYFYRKNFLKNLYEDCVGSQIMHFLEDVKKVYPGIVDGTRRVGLQLKDFDVPTVESQKIQDLIPEKRQRLLTIQEEIEALEDSDEETGEHYY